MKILFDFLPIVLFFISYKIFGIYTATAIAMAASFSQVVYFRIKYQRFERMHLISLALILILGGATLLFKNPSFIKWKPTGIYWITATAFLGSRIFGQKTLTQKMMESNICLPATTWHALNYAWVSFFFVMGMLNLYVAFHFDTDTWVNFKLFGGAGCTLVFIALQALYLNQHLQNEKSTKVNIVNLKN